MELTIAEAAARLGVSARQAQRLAATGRLQIVRRVGRTIIVDGASVTAATRTAVPGRRWSARTAWAAIELLEHGSTSRLTGSDRSRLKARLRQIDVDELVRNAVGRALALRMSQTRRRAEALRRELVLSGGSALESVEFASRFGLSAGANGMLEGYVVAGELEVTLSRFGLVADAEGEVLLRVSDVTPVPGAVVAALDLIERGSVRERAAARRVLEEALRG